MTDRLRGAGLVLGKAKRAAGLTVGQLPDWMLPRVCGKKIVEAVRIALLRGLEQLLDCPVGKVILREVDLRAKVL